VDLNLGFGLMFAAFAAAIVGGFGSLNGVIAGAMLLGFAEYVVGGYFYPSYASTYAFIVMIAVIAFRPQGLFGGKYARL
jgi:branched-chain amino acid transport system permease protein